MNRKNPTMLDLKPDPDKVDPDPTCDPIIFWSNLPNLTRPIATSNRNHDSSRIGFPNNTTSMQRVGLNKKTRPILQKIRSLPNSHKFGPAIFNGKDQA
jgi:hypothetical protein